MSIGWDHLKVAQWILRSWCWDGAVSFDKEWWEREETLRVTLAEAARVREHMDNQFRRQRVPREELTLSDRRRRLEDRLLQLDVDASATAEDVRAALDVLTDPGDGLDELEERLDTALRALDAVSATAKEDPRDSRVTERGRVSDRSRILAVVDTTRARAAVP